MRNSTKPVGVLSVLLLCPATILTVSTARAQEASDPTYKGSSFNEVLAVVEDRGFSPQTQEEADELAVYQSGVLPHYPVTFKSLGRLGLPLFRASKKTLVSRADYYPRFEKLVHSNGACVSGQWQITQPSPYTGYFKQGTKALFVGRISAATNEIARGGSRAFGFAGKLFPTTNPSAVVATSNFFTVDVLSGTDADRFLDVNLTNSPPLHPRWDLAGILSKIIPAFAKADSQPTFRPVTHLARSQDSSSTKPPIFMRLRPASGVVKNNQEDFRAEVLEAFSQNKGHLQYLIDVSETTGERNAQTGWTNIGTITLDNAVVSYGCDRRLHFAHPKDDKSNKSVTEAKK